MSNIFKSQPRPRNNFNPDEETVVPKFEIKESDFPDLIQPTSKPTSSQQGMNYKLAAVEKEIEKIEDDEKEEVVEPGWVRYSIDPVSKNTVIVNGFKDQDQDQDQDQEQDLYTHIDNIIQSMAERWENDKSNYYNLHGEEEYDKIYSVFDNEYDSEYDSEDY